MRTDTFAITALLHLRPCEAVRRRHIIIISNEANHGRRWVIQLVNHAAHFRLCIGPTCTTASTQQVPRVLGHASATPLISVHTTWRRPTCRVKASARQGIHTKRRTFLMHTHRAAFQCMHRACTRTCVCVSFTLAPTGYAGRKRKSNATRQAHNESV
jgi:hypothetical protein